MERKFDKVFEAYVRLVEEDMPPPEEGGGDASEPAKPCFTNTEGIEYLVPFIRLYNKGKEGGTLPDRLTKLMIADRAFLPDMSSATIKKRLRRIYRVAGITDTEVERAKQDNKRAFDKAASGGEPPEVRPVGVSELRGMLDILGTLADSFRDDAMHGTTSGRTPATEVGFPNRQDIDFANIWVAYNRIAGNVKDEYRSGV